MQEGAGRETRWGEGVSAGKISGKQAFAAGWAGWWHSSSEDRRGSSEDRRPRLSRWERLVAQAGSGRQASRLSR